MSDKHALIIDDNSKNVAVLARLLEAQNVSSSQVTDPRRLDSILDTLDNLDVVFLDLEMPNLDGFQVLSKLKSDKRFGSVPVICYTVHVSEISVAHREGFDGFIGKPLDSDRFPNQLKRILNGEPVWEAV